MNQAAILSLKEFSPMELFLLMKTPDPELVKEITYVLGNNKLNRLYNKYLSKDINQLRKIIEEEGESISEEESRVIEDIMKHYIPTNQEVMYMIYNNPDYIHSYEAFYNDNLAMFPFIIQLLSDNRVSLVSIEKYLRNTRKTYSLKDLIEACIEYLPEDGNLTSYFDMFTKILGEKNITNDYLYTLFDYSLPTIVHEWVSEMIRKRTKYAPKPSHVVYFPIDVDNLPSLQRVNVDDSIIQEFMNEMVPEAVNALNSLEDYPQLKKAIEQNIKLNVPEILGSEALEHWFGPTNYRDRDDILTEEDINDPEKKYGEYRMLLDTSNEGIEDDFAMDNDQWFTGNCEYCDLKISYLHYAVRRPVADGGWKGCFCSWTCIIYYINDLIDEYITNFLNLDPMTMKTEQLIPYQEDHVMIKKWMIELDLIEDIFKHVNIADRNEENIPSETYPLKEKTREELCLEMGVDPKVFSPPFLEYIKKDEGTKTFDGKWNYPTLNTSYRFD